jgi:hypothetical protein
LWESRAAWAGAFTLIGALAAFTLTQGVDSLSNVRVLPAEARQTYHSFLSWYYDDNLWTGTWSSREEGHIDDYRQAALPIELIVGTERGKVFGPMFNRNVCEMNPMLPPVLIEGEIRGKTLVAFAYAYAQGQRSILYTFEVEQEADSIVALVRPLRDPMNLLPPEARLVRRIESQTELTDTVVVPEATHPDLKCAESALEYLQRLRREGKLPSVEELGIGRPKTESPKR